MEVSWSTIAVLLLAFSIFVPSNSIMPKPGHCPSTFNTLLPAQRCDYDRNCPGEEKCCFYFGQSVCAPPVPIIQRCPMHRGEMGICLEECSSDYDCSEKGPGYKCCFNGCGHVCMTSERTKPGICGPLMFYPICRIRCQDDSDCGGDQKCCPTACGNICREPIFE